MKEVAVEQWVSDVVFKAIMKAGGVATWPRLKRDIHGLQVAQIRVALSWLEEQDRIVIGMMAQRPIYLTMSRFEEAG